MAAKKEQANDGVGARELPIPFQGRPPSPYLPRPVHAPFDRKNAEAPPGTNGKAKLAGKELSEEELVAKCSKLTVNDVAWIGSHLNTRNVEEEHAPSRIAWNLLLFARETPGNQSDFWARFTLKLLPTQSQLDQARRFEDDGREILDLIDKAEADYIAAESDKVVARLAAAETEMREGVAC